MRRLARRMMSYWGGEEEMMMKGTLTRTMRVEQNAGGLSSTRMAVAGSAMAG